MIQYQQLQHCSSGYPRPCVGVHSCAEQIWSEIQELAAAAWLIDATAPVLLLSLTVFSHLDTASNLPVYPDFYYPTPFYPNDQSIYLTFPFHAATSQQGLAVSHLERYISIITVYNCCVCHLPLTIFFMISFILLSHLLGAYPLLNLILGETKAPRALLIPHICFCGNGVTMPGRGSV